MNRLEKIINEEIEEGWGKNLAAGAMMTAATLGGMNASAQNSQQQDKQQPEITNTQTQMYSTNPRIARMQRVQSDRLFFRAYGVGTASDEKTAEKLALLNAREKLEQQMGLRGIDDNPMKGMRYDIDDNMMIKGANGQYTCHIMVSMKKPKR